MPWKELTAMSQKQEFVTIAIQEGVNISKLCKDYNVSRTTAYKWLRRQANGQGIEDKSRRPHTSPLRTEPEMEKTLLNARLEHPAWGPRKLKRYLENHEYTGLPAASTISAILKRNGLTETTESTKHKAYQRFVKAYPNQMWQMDFKGYFQMGKGGYCHPLTTLDDHSRYLVGLRACVDERMLTVKEQLINIFRTYGLPESILTDNGSPWASPYSQCRHTELSVWLMQLGILIKHGRPRHPQTQGKDERVHRTLKEELLKHRRLDDLSESQEVFDNWRELYNNERPHEALDLATPVTRYQRSSREYPEKLPAIVYDTSMAVRKVDESGKFYFKNKIFRLGKAFRYTAIGIKPTEEDGIFSVYFGINHLADLSLKELSLDYESVNDVPEQL